MPEDAAQGAGATVDALDALSTADLEKMTKVQLLKLAQNASLSTVSEAMTKADIIGAIEAAATAPASGE